MMKIISNGWDSTIRIPHLQTILFFLSIFFSPAVLSQTYISGIAADETEQPLAFANVLLLHPHDSSLIKGVISESDGDFKIENVETGKYLLMVSMIGYQSSRTSIQVENIPITLGIVPLKEDNLELQEVVINSQKPLYQQQIDRLVINVQNSITSAGSTALEVLERSPGITLDKQNGAISMNGKAGVQVMVNGKLSRLPVSALIQMLEGMNAGNIEKIELIANPSARYDAEGSAGMVHIILKKNTERGSNGSFSATAGYGWYGKTGAILNLNHRTEKLNLFGDYSWSYNHNWNELGNNRLVINQGVPVQTYSRSSSPNTNNSHTPRFGFDYQLSPKTIIGGVISGFSNYQNVKAINTIQIQEGLKLPSHIIQNTYEKSLWRHLMGNLNIRHSLGEKQEISVDLDYLEYYNSSPASYHIDYQIFETGETTHEKIRIDKTTPIKFWVFKADYSFLITDKTKLEAGAKGTFSQVDNEVVVERMDQQDWYRDKKFSQKIDMEENIVAGYASFNHQINSKTDLQVGLRWEHTYTNINSPEQQNLVHRNYHNLFPSLFISRKLNENNNLQFSYSRRISRPTYNNLVPFVSFKDPYSFWSGNAELKPTITDALQLTYQIKKNYLLSLNASFDENAMNWLVSLDQKTNQQNVYIANVDHTKSYSFNFSFPLEFTKWWQMQNNLSAIWQNNNTMYEGSRLQLIGYYGRINSTQNFKLPHNFNIEVSGYYQSKALFGIFQQNPQGSLNLGIQKKLENNRGTFNFSISDVFWTNRFKIKLAYPSDNLDQVFYYTPEPRVIRLTYSRNFGNKNVKAANKRNTGSEDERRRVGN